MSKSRLKAKFVELLSYLRFARYVSASAVAISQFFLNNLQADDYSNEIIKYVIINVLIPHRDWGWYLLLLGAIAWIASEIGIGIKKFCIDKKKCETCKQEREQQIEADYKYRLSRLLMRVLDEKTTESVKLNEKDHRISVYLHDQRVKQFILGGRYSNNHTYKNSGRPFYPDNQGVIRKAWDEGEAMIEITNDPDQNIDSYCDENLREWKIPQADSRNFKMKSLYYSAHAIENNKGHRIAIVVWESTKRIKPTQKTHSQLKGILPQIKLFLEENERFAPLVSSAHDEGL